MKAQAKDGHHSLVTGDVAESSIARVIMDYCFFREDMTTTSSEFEERAQAVASLVALVMMETRCHSIWAYAVESKGAGEEWVVE